MKDKIKKILEIVITILIIALVILWYPWFTSVNEYGETVCKNIFGKVSRCNR